MKGFKKPFILDRYIFETLKLGQMTVLNRSTAGVFTQFANDYNNYNNHNEHSNNDQCECCAECLEIGRCHNGMILAH